MSLFINLERKIIELQFLPEKIISIEKAISIMFKLSLIKIINSKGPRIYPWGTPEPFKKYVLFPVL